MLCGTLTNLFALSRVRTLVERVRDVLAPGGHIAIATWLRDRDPVGAAFGVQMLVATPEGDAPSHTDYDGALRATGYADIRLSEVGDPPLAVITARRRSEEAPEA